MGGGGDGGRGCKGISLAPSVRHGTDSMALFTTSKQPGCQVVFKAVHRKTHIDVLPKSMQGQITM